MAKSGMSTVDDEGEESENLDESAPQELPEEDIGDSVRVVSKRTKVSTPISILIESLVKNLCSVYESDVNKAGMMYRIICEKLFEMNMIDKSYQMNEFESMRTQYQRAFYHLLTAARGGQSPLTGQPAWPNQDATNSHYYREFEEVEFIAGGGFGQVYKVKHKLDGTEYAVKKIPIRAEGLEAVKNYLSEVKTFASVNHPNIVQYKAAWLDLGAPNNALNDCESETEAYDSYFPTNKPKIKEHVSDEYIFNQERMESFSDYKLDDSTDFEVDFEHSINSLKSCSSSKLKNSSKTRSKRRASVSEGANVLCRLSNREIQKIRLERRLNAKWATLYIQMALCQSTLKQWLEKRNSEMPNDNAKAIVPVQVTNDAVHQILQQLLKGLQYIHSKGIVHHDIKPSNIFIQIDNGKLLVQLGDFGLACPLQSVRHSLALGTRLYAAPEQLAGECNPKSDMYSLGIVLFELVESFRTDMERVQHISELQKGILPVHLVKQQPQLSHIIGQLVSKGPQDRPDAATLLKAITHKQSESEQIQELRCQLAEKEEEINRLRELLKSAGVKSI